MTKDEIWLRKMIRDWERRFVDGLNPSVQLLILAKNKFLEDYGFEELKRVVNEVTMEVHNELSEVRTGGKRIRPNVSVLRKAMAKQNRRKWSRQCRQVPRH